VICVVAPAASLFTFENCLAQPAAARLVDRMRLLAYEALFANPELPIGSYIFAGIDQLTPVGRRIVGQCRDALAKAAADIVLLNDPARTFRRYHLLHTAFESGVNEFRAARATSALQRFRFPVFVRSEREHSGSLTPLIRSRRELAVALLGLTVRGFRLRDLLVVEYCNTAGSNGVYRKYSAFIVGDQVIPRALVQSRDWVTKDGDRIITAQTAEEEFRYVTGNPHQAWLRDVFRMAGVGYGRMDYGLLGDTPQLWEINLCPTIGGPPGGSRHSTRTAAQRQLLAPARDHFYDRFVAALERLERPRAGNSRSVHVPIAPADALALRQQLRERAHEQARRTVPARLARRLAGLLRRRASPGQER
jgi:hypothetical protein